MEISTKANNIFAEGPQEFANRIMKTISSATIALSLSLGVDTGLFEILTNLEKPSTTTEIAKLAGLKERYVREWLGSMVVANIVEIDPSNNTYSVPEHRIPFLRKGPSNVVALSGLVPLLCQAYEPVSTCFKIQGPEGVAYSQYPRFHRFMDHMSRAMHDNNLVQNLIPTYPGLMELLESGIYVLDVGCGSGHAPILMAQRFPRSTFHGVDISEEAIEVAKDEALRLSLTNCTFEVQDAVSLRREWTNKFQLVTSFDAIHDMPYPEEVLREAYRVLAPSAMIMILEIDVSSNPSQNIGNPRAVDGYVISLMHCMPVSLYFNKDAGLGIMWGREAATKMLQETGFGEVTSKTSKDRFNVIITGRKKLD